MIILQFGKQRGSLRASLGGRRPPPPAALFSFLFLFPLYFSMFASKSSYPAFSHSSLWACPQFYQGPLANLARVSMATQLYRQDPLTGPPLTQADANLAQTRATFQRQQKVL